MEYVFKAMFGVLLIEGIGEARAQVVLGIFSTENVRFYHT